MSRLRSLFLVFIGLFCTDSLSASVDLSGTEMHLIAVDDLQFQSTGPGPANAFFKKQARFSRKVNAAIYAFPFPFGIVGLHRIYLGCAPYVPVVYIASFGGIFGLLPLIDFVVILTEKDVEQFANSGKVFMWVE